MNIKRALEVVKDLSRKKETLRADLGGCIFPSELYAVIQALAEPEEKECEQFCYHTETLFFKGRCTICGRKPYYKEIKPDPIRKEYLFWKESVDKEPELFLDTSFSSAMWLAIKQHCTQP